MVMPYSLQISAIFGIVYRLYFEMFFVVGLYQQISKAVSLNNNNYSTFISLVLQTLFLYLAHYLPVIQMHVFIRGLYRKYRFILTNKFAANIIFDLCLGC